jgi:hypothetical protein
MLAAAAALILGSAVSVDAGCDFEHPRKAKVFQTDFVQAFVSCGGGSAPNTTSASGIPGCTPPETFNQLYSTPIDGWQWDERRSRGQLLIREVQDPFGIPNSRNAKMKLRLRRILDGTGNPANGFGTLALLLRVTLEDTVVSAPGMGTDLTMVDFPAPFTIQMVDGNGTLGGVLFPQPFGVPLLFFLPGCSSMEIVSVAVLDPNGNPFGRPGVFLKDLPN